MKRKRCLFVLVPLFCISFLTSCNNNKTKLADETMSVGKWEIAIEHLTKRAAEPRSALHRPVLFEFGQQAF